MFKLYVLKKRLFLLLESKVCTMCVGERERILLPKCLQQLVRVAGGMGRPGLQCEGDRNPVT